MTTMLTSDATTRVNQGRWCQEWWPTSDGSVRRRAMDLRRRGYKVVSAPMGHQTATGCRMTLLSITPGTNADTFGVGA